jgi:hypothetical protein
VRTDRNAIVETDVLRARQKSVGITNPRFTMALLRERHVNYPLHSDGGGEITGTTLVLSLVLICAAEPNGRIVRVGDQRSTPGGSYALP